MLILQVAVNGFRAADDVDRNIVGLVVFGQQAGVGVGVVAADDHQRADAQRFAVLTRRFKMFFRFQFGSAGTDHVEAPGVAVVVNNFGGKFDVFVFNQAVRAFFEAIELAVLVEDLMPS
jgi:hypothetical protein